VAIIFLGNSSDSPARQPHLSDTLPPTLPPTPVSSATPISSKGEKARTMQTLARMGTRQPRSIYISIGPRSRHRSKSILKPGKNWIMSSASGTGLETEKRTRSMWSHWATMCKEGWTNWAIREATFGSPCRVIQELVGLLDF
jgi:hypothetical protein